MFEGVAAARAFQRAVAATTLTMQDLNDALRRLGETRVGTEVASGFNILHGFERPTQTIEEGRNTQLKRDGTYSKVEIDRDLRRMSRCITLTIEIPEANLQANEIKEVARTVDAALGSKTMTGADKLRMLALLIEKVAEHHEPEFEGDNGDHVVRTTRGARLLDLGNDDT